MVLIQETAKQDKLNEISNQNPTKSIIHIDDGENYKPLNENTNWCTIFNVIIGSETRINEIWGEFEQNQISN